MEGQTQRKHLLIVDDEPVILQILKAVFEDEPVRLTCVGNGTDALRVLDEQPVDLVITDKNLPDVNGIELLKAAKTNGHSRPEPDPCNATLWPSAGLSCGSWNR